MSFWNSIISRLQGFGERLKVATEVASTLITNPHLTIGYKFKRRIQVECWRDGKLAWAEDVYNLIPDAGANDILSQYFKGSAYTAAFYVGLIDNASFSAIANADTMSSHGGWTESTAYSNANRPTLTLGSVSSRSVNNSGSVAAFNINATATINGAFIATNNTKGGTSGVLSGAASFGSTRSVISGDTLNVTITLSA